MKIGWKVRRYMWFVAYARLGASVCTGRWKGARTKLSRSLYVRTSDWAGAGANQLCDRGLVCVCSAGSGLFGEHAKIRCARVEEYPAAAAVCGSMVNRIVNFNYKVVAHSKISVAFFSRVAGPEDGRSIF